MKRSQRDSPLAPLLPNHETNTFSPGAQHAIDCHDSTGTNHYLPDGHFTLHVAHG